MKSNIPLLDLIEILTESKVFVRGVMVQREFEYGMFEVSREITVIEKKVNSLLYINYRNMNAIDYHIIESDKSKRVPTQHELLAIAMYYKQEHMKAINREEENEIFYRPSSTNTLKNSIYTSNLCCEIFLPTENDIDKAKKALEAVLASLS